MKEHPEMWSMMPQQQQRGAQLGDRQPGEPPADAVEDRAAQDHEQADREVSPGGDRPQQGGAYPADRIEDRAGDNTPSAPDPHVEWDQRVQPERGEGADEDLPSGEDIERGA